MIEIAAGVSIDESEIEEEFVRASGPGGQNVNKVATAVLLRFDLAACETIPDDVKDRVMRAAGSRITDQGVIVIRARRYRTRERNRRDARDRLVELIRRHLEPPKPRRKTKPTAASKVSRRREKEQRGRIKKLRGRITSKDEE